MHSQRLATPNFAQKSGSLLLIAKQKAVDAEKAKKKEVLVGVNYDSARPAIARRKFQLSKVKDGFQFGEKVTKGKRTGRQLACADDTAIGNGGRVDEADKVMNCCS